MGDVSPTRDFNYVEDTCRGFMALGSCDQAIDETVSIGSNFEISIANTFNIIKELMSSDAEIVVDVQRRRPEKSEVFRLWCDNSKVEKLTGLKPQIDLREGLRRIIEWFSVKESLSL